MKKLSSILCVLVLTAISCFGQIRFEAAFRKVSKRFERDTVYLAYYQPYTYTYMENRIAQWASHDWVSVDTPDGVANGLSRSNITGVNQEINFARSEDSTVVEVRAIKKVISDLSKERPFDVALNLHSQVANHASYWLDSLNLRDFGRRLLMATAESMNISLPGRAIVLPPAKASAKWEAVSMEELTYMGDIAWKPVNMRCICISLHLTTRSSAKGRGAGNSLTDISRSRTDLGNIITNQQKRTA